MKKFMKLLWAAAIIMIVGVTAVEATSCMSPLRPQLKQLQSVGNSR